MTTGTITVTVSPDVQDEIDAVMQRTGRDAASIAGELLTEAVKMRRVPGIVFVDGTAGRVPRVAGTGLEVFEIVGPYRDMGGDFERLRVAFHWLSEQQLRAAIAYAEAYPPEVEARLRDEERWTSTATYATYPLTRPERE